MWPPSDSSQRHKRLWLPAQSFSRCQKAGTNQQKYSFNWRLGVRNIGNGVTNIGSEGEPVLAAETAQSNQDHHQVKESAQVATHSKDCTCPRSFYQCSFTLYFYI